MILDRLTIAGITYTIVASDDLDEDREGQFDAEKSEIQISKRFSKNRYWSILRHEIGHAAWHECGMKSALTQGFGFSEDIADRVEETIMSVFVPIYCEALERKGLLKPATCPKKGTK